MASCSITKRAPQVPSAAKLQGPIPMDGRTYVLEPPMQKEKTTLCLSHVLILSSLADTTHALMD